MISIKKKMSMTSVWSRRLFILSFLLPTLALFALFTIYPLIRGLYLSFFDWSGGSETMNFIGVNNYKELFSDSIIPTAIKNDYFLIFWKVILIMLLATFFAVALTRLRLKEYGFYRIIFFFPNIISVVVIGVLWSFIYNPSLGFLNAFLSLFTKNPIEINWLGSPNLAIWSLLPPSVWAGIGFYMLLIIASILGIPNSLYEAASIDGANEWKQFTGVTLPLIWEQFKTSIIHIVITTLNGSFIIVKLMTDGGPDNQTQVLGYYLYQMGFKQYHLSYGATIGVLILVLSLITTLLINRILHRDTIEM
ncbi:N-acetylglucosamine transport system permease protein [Paenibacillus castaneae]|uniref:carbohydrate ABC transporter permease n=1 Tax=Paenibacillus castaneae TaxID=474957 RepID=UPI001FBA7F06|nr:sugar ABC transporter permease [Paenibacillus castaneae]NIK76583.1 N-acetylglucosamine transport system permease protein [Paenibacillus castaneae]